jgi:hypothetical protein
MSVTESFAKLKEEIDNADREIKAAAEQDRGDIQAKVDDARRLADKRAAELRKKTGDAATEADSHWHEVGAAWDRHIERVRQHIDATKTAVDRDVAVHDADAAYSDANDAIDFARSAVGEAEYAVLEALQAEKHARQLGAPL